MKPSVSFTQRGQPPPQAQRHSPEFSCGARRLRSTARGHMTLRLLTRPSADGVLVMGGHFAGAALFATVFISRTVTDPVQRDALRFAAGFFAAPAAFVAGDAAAAVGSRSLSVPSAASFSSMSCTFTTPACKLTDP